MSSTRGSSVERNGSVRALVTRYDPTTTRTTPTAAAISPRSWNGRNWSVTRSTIVSARPPGRISLVTWRMRCATPSASRTRPAKTTSSQRLTPMPGVSQRRRFSREPREPPSRTLQLPVEDRDGSVVRLPEPARQLLGERDRAVVAAGAPESDREPRLALADVGRQRELEVLVEVL